VGSDTEDEVGSEPGFGDGREIPSQARTERVVSCTEVHLHDDAQDSGWVEKEQMMVVKVQDENGVQVVHAAPTGAT
jgi:hypothetical protein